MDSTYHIISLYYYIECKFQSLEYNRSNNKNNLRGWSTFGNFVNNLHIAHFKLHNYPYKNNRFLHFHIVHSLEYCRFGMMMLVAKHYCLLLPYSLKYIESKLFLFGNFGNMVGIFNILFCLYILLLHSNSDIGNMEFLELL